MIAQNPPLVQFHEVTKVYGEGETAVTALNHVSMTIEAGDFVAVMGPSGSGKSTCMNIVGCLDTPTFGRYLFRGVEVGTLSGQQLSLLRRHYLGFVFQGYNLLKRTTALENVELPLVYRGVRRRERQRRAWQALDEVGLLDRHHHSPAQLSGGQQQRVAIARALVTEPHLLLADEPTGNLDSARSVEIMELLRRLNNDRGITIVMVTHEEDMARFARRRIHFHDGEIEADVRRGGPPPCG
jgi:putative ABC transport system ATP-binding protein